MTTRRASLLAAGVLLLMANDALAAACRSLAEAGKRAEALECYRGAVKRNPDDLESRNAVATLLAEQKKYRSALAEFEAVLERKPSDGVALNGKAMMLLALDRVDEGFATLQKAIELDPKNVQALHNLALLNFRHGHDKIAVALWLQVVKIVPDHPDANVGLGEVLLRQGRNDEALGYFEKAIAKDGRHARAIWLAGKAVSHARPADAIPYFERAARLGNEAEPWYDLGLARMLTGQWRLAGQALTQAMKYAPDDYRVYLELGKVHTEMRYYDDALAHFEEVYRLKPPPEAKVAARYHIGIVRERQGQKTKAASEYLQALEMDPRHVPSMLNLAALHAEAQRYEEAKEILDRALAVAPQNPIARFNLGKVLLAQGRTEAGRKELQALLALPETDPLRREAEAILAGRHQP